VQIATLILLVSCVEGQLSDFSLTEVFPLALMGEASTLCWGRSPVYSFVSGGILDVSCCCAIDSRKEVEAGVWLIAIDFC
jgi:hypothetical protein